MEKEIGLFKSIRTKLFLSLCIIVIAIIISLILLNNFVLRKFYEYNKEKQLVCGEIILFPDKKKVYKDDKEINLTAKEYQLLEYLMYNQENVLTKENILEHVWGLDGQFVGDNTVSVTINRLRKKIESDAASPVYLKNVFGLGYKLECV